MRFATTFNRQKGGTGAPALGSDVVPVKPPGQLVNNDCVHTSRFWSLNGWPVQRLAAYWTTTAATPTVLNASLYLWDSLTGSWVLVNSAVVAMTQGILYYFDIPAIIEPTPTMANLAQAHAGSTAAMLLMADPGAQVAGTFVVAMAPDVSTIGA